MSARKPGWAWILAAIGACALLAVIGLRFSPQLVMKPCPATWTNIWQDDFAGASGAEVNTSFWHYDTGNGFGNNETEVMTSSRANVFLSGTGVLNIRALDENGQWTSGRINSARLFGAAAGCELRVLASIRLPAPADGLGYWPAFWMLGPGQWPQNGEIDILEDVNGLEYHSAALHCGNLTDLNPDDTYGPCREHTGVSSGMLPCSGCLTGYHTYSVTIDRRRPGHEQITWYLDQHEFFSVREDQLAASVWHRAVDHDFSIILDLAIGGTYPDVRCGCATPTAATASGGILSVDYVRVYVR